MENNMNTSSRPFIKQYFVISRSRTNSKHSVESEFETEDEASAEAIRLLKQGQIVEMGEEFVGGTVL